MSCGWSEQEPVLLIGGVDGAWIVPPQCGHVELGDPDIPWDFEGTETIVHGDCEQVQAEYLVGAPDSRSDDGQVWLLTL